MAILSRRGAGKELSQLIYIFAEKRLHYSYDLF